MATRSNAGEEEAEESEQSHVLRSVGGAVLALVVAFSMWQSSPQRERDTTPKPQRHAAGPSVAVATVPGSAVVDRRTPPAQAHAAGQSQPVIYLVSSEGQSARLIDTLQAGDQILAGMGRPPFVWKVLVVTSLEDADFFARATAEADSIRAMLGLPPLAVLDLRMP